MRVQSTNQTIGIIGLGTMGSALARGLAARVERGRLLGFDRYEARASDLPVTPTASARELIDRSAVVILAVKPQQLTELQPELGSIGDRLLISILAGTPLRRLETLGSERIVRAMPNLAALVGESLTGWVGSAAVTGDDRATVERLLTSIGPVIALETEAQFDALTAISGSGPGYLAWFSETLTAAAASLGFDAETAETIVRQTVVGSAKLFSTDRRSFADIRNDVTSKGGTTEAALTILNEHGVSETIQAAVRAANERAQAIAREQS